MSHKIIRTCPSCGVENRVPASHLSRTGKCGACKGPLGPLREPLEVGAGEFDAVVSAAPVPVLVDFWAPWCGPCRISAPHVAAVAQSAAGRALVLKVNTDEHPDLGQRFDIRGIPAFLVFNQGRKVLQEAGAVDRRQLEAWLHAAEAGA